MANRNFNRKQALEREIKEVYCQIAIGSSGAPTLTRGTGVASVTRDSAGVYILTLQDTYQRLMHASVTQLVASPQDLTFQLEAEAVATAKTVQFRCNTGATETDPASGSILYVVLQLKNSSVV